MKPSWIFAAVLACITISDDALAQPAMAPYPLPTCLNAATWTLLDGERFRTAGTGEVLTRLAKRDVLLLGEYHDNDDHHRWQLQTLAALQALQPNMVIGFEMFPRHVQAVLDRWVSGKLTEKQFLEQSEWGKIWNLPAELYMPLFQFARINRIPMVALNVDQKLSKAIAEKGWDAVPEVEREGVGRPAPPSGAYRDLLFEIHRQHVSAGGKDSMKSLKSDSTFRHFVESQTTWDRAMAEALARQRTTADKPLVVGIMGSAHIRFGYGVPHQLRALGIKDVGTLLALPADEDCKDVGAGLADAVFALPTRAIAKAEQPRLGVRLDDHEDGVHIAQVTADSLADKSGLKTGDRVLEVGGLPAKKAASMIASVRQQPAGTWLPLRVQRGDQTLEVVIKFPPKP
jgi:uncharacterized iron-regulated protein